VQNLGTFANPSYVASNGAAYNWNTAPELDYIGMAAYPCRTDLDAGQGGCDIHLIDRVHSAQISSGVQPDQIVPIYQVFGDGQFAGDTGGYYQLPTVTQLGQILEECGNVLGSDVAFWDYAYSWGSQQGNTALANSTDLQTFFLWRNDSSSRR
jgi:hypothetical protein